MPDKVAILLDGGFVKKKLQDRHGRFPTVPEVVGVTTTLMGKPRLDGTVLFRTFYYDAPPFEGIGQNPISRAPLNFSTTPQAGQNRSLIDALELEPDFAVRRGVIVQSGWKLGRAALRALARTPAR